MNLTDILAVGGQLYYQIKRYASAAAGSVMELPVIHFDAFGKMWQLGPCPLKCMGIKGQPAATNATTGSQAVTSATNG